MRYEFKYFVPNEKLEMLRKMVQPFVDLDKFALGRPNDDYTVRSIYFDTPGLRCYDEKVEGLAHRKKVRLRGYDRGGEDSTVFMEIKRKYEVPILKNRAPMTFAGAKGILSGQVPIEMAVQNSGKFPDAQDNVRRFLYQINHQQMRPVVLVIYDREPYLSKTDPTIRVTFDKNLRAGPYPTLDGLFKDERLRPCLTNQFILEVKFNDYYPSWMKPITAALGLKWSSASKYVISMDAHQIGYHTRKAAVLAKGNLFDPRRRKPVRPKPTKPQLSPAPSKAQNIPQKNPLSNPASSPTARKPVQPIAKP